MVPQVDHLPTRAAGLADSIAEAVRSRCSGCVDTTQKIPHAPEATVHQVLEVELAGVGGGHLAQALELAGSRALVLSLEGGLVEVEGRAQGTVGRR